MASFRIFALATSVICLLSLFQKMYAAQITNREVSGLLSLLNSKLPGNKKPVIIIIEKEGHSLQNKPVQMTSSEEHDPINIPHFLHDKVAKNKIIKDSTPSYLTLLQQGQKSRQRYGPQRNRLIEDRGKEVDKKVLRSSIVKKLLRISNGIQCDAKDNCENKCQNKYNGKKVYTCQIQCEVKYDCEEEAKKEEDDECESGCEDSCGDDCNNMMSTKGEMLGEGDNLFEGENNCKRC